MALGYAAPRGKQSGAERRLRIVILSPERETEMSDEANAKATVKEQRAIQRQVDAADAKSGGDEDGGAMQAGGRRYPEPPFPEQHLKKPGLESDLDPKPMFEAPYYKGSEKLQDMAAIITGGDSGIGRAVAVLFAREGCDVAIVYLDETGDAKVTQQAVEKEGRRCLLLKGDVRDPGFCRTVVEQTVAEFGKLDVLVNNAAFQLHVSDFADLTPEHFDETLKTNLYGMYYLTHAAVPHMKPGSAIVNCGSVVALMGNENLLDYSLTKGGIHAFSRSLSTHLVGKGIRVNVVAPGPVWTPLNPADQKPEKVAKFGADTPMKRPAQPEEIAPAFVFLASPHCSSYITGEVLPVIGGYSSR